MTFYAWPEHWFPREFSLRILPNIRDFEGAYTPTTDVIDLLGERWLATVTMPPQEDPIEIAAMEAFFDRLKGRAHGITMPHQKLPVPQGTLRGNPTVSGAVAQLANTMTIANATAGVNLLRFSGFQTDAGGGIPNGTSEYSSGSVVGGSRSLQEFGGQPGASLSCLITASQLGTGAGDQYGFTFSARIPVVAGRVYTLSADVIGQNNAHLRVYVDWYPSSVGGTLIGPALTARSAMTGSAQRVVGSQTAPAGATHAQVFAWIEQRLGAPLDVFAYVDNMQFEEGTLATAYAGLPTLRAGDMLSVQGQLVRVMADVTLNDAGTGTVEFQPRVRASAGWPNASAITWARPTANFILRNRDGVPQVWQPGFADGASFELIEVFTPT